jgi:thermitase
MMPSKPPASLISFAFRVVTVISLAVAAGLLGRGQTAGAQRAVDIPASEINDPGAGAPGRILVKFRADAEPAEIGRLHSIHGSSVDRVLNGIEVTRIKVPPGQEKAIAAEYRRSGAVEFAELDAVMRTQFTPNDTYYATPYATTKDGSIAQWAPQAISAPSAWDVTMGDPGVVIAVVDTGVDTAHPDLQGKFVGGTALVGSIKDQHGHGTHVAGIAAANTNNGVGVAGICPRCSIMPVRVLDANGSGLLSDVADGIVYAADHGARVINLSLGSASVSQTMRSAVDYAFAHNALPVSAMGNSAAADAVEPAYWFNALSVGAVDKTGAKASFSNFGPKTDVVAPGVAILSTMPTYSVSMTQTYKQNYDALSGTSMATPVVSGVAGLVLSRNPALTAGQLKGVIQASAGDGKSFNTTTGFGLVDAAKAVTLAAGTDTSAPSVSISSPALGSTVTKTMILTASPSDNKGVHHVDFVIDGTRAGVPGTASSGGGGGRKGATNAAWSTQWESTRYWNGGKTLTAVAFDTSGNTASQTGVFTISNSYTTVTWTAHLCNPPSGACDYYMLKNVVPSTTAAVRVQVTWNYTKLESYNGLTWALLNNGQAQETLFTSQPSIDWYPDLPLCGTLNNCSIKGNDIGAGMTQILKGQKSGSAEADFTVTLTYPQ